MRRLHLFEVEDLAWCPQVIRKGITDYLESSMAFLRQYRVILPKLAPAIARSGSLRVVDLCSGSGGPWLWARDLLNGGVSPELQICLTDKFPPARPDIPGAPANIVWDRESVDATAVPRRLVGFRTMFTAFHHFRPREAKRILADAASSGQGIGVFEVTERRALTLLLMLTTPLWVFLVTPFMRPVRLSRLFWTYVIPAIPMATTFDGIVSCLRTYSPAELRELTADLGGPDYRWEIGRERLPGLPMGVIYLLGQPKEAGGPPLS